MNYCAILAYSILALYTIILGYICLYCLFQFQLLYHYKKTFLKIPDVEKKLTSFPHVTIQLPIYNEKYVVDRLIDAICSIDYPKEKLQIQVLDDSTDETVGLLENQVRKYARDGFDISYIRRIDRKGYKAGALQNGMNTVKGEFIAIFDADFVPSTDFLLKTIPHFEDPKIGVVQTRWDHLNKDFSLITKVQALQLNVHFTVEQKGRDNGSHFLQFNGTAGLWRTATILDSGGWKADTLTEDLDLSYRAQLNGWKIKFLEHIASPAELPMEMNSFKSQQYRWMKGGAETAKKLLPLIWSSPLTFVNKIHASLHLLGSTVFIFIFALGILSVPTLFAMRYLMINASVWSIFFVSSAALVIIYYVASVQNPLTALADSRWKSFLKFTVLFPLFLSLSMGLSLHNSIAVVQGYLGKKTPFVRTPKFNILHQNKKDSTFHSLGYKNLHWDWKIILEGLLACYFLLGIYQGIKWHDYSMIFFHILLFYGYSCIFYYSMRDIYFK